MSNLRSWMILLFLAMIVSLVLVVAGTGGAVRAAGDQAAEPHVPVTVGSTTLVSVSTSGVTGNGESLNPSISNNGRFVAFESKASNLVPGDTNDVTDVFVHDRQTGQSERISVSEEGVQGDNASYSPHISADGRYVVFVSLAENLLPYVVWGGTNIYLKDRNTGYVELISVTPEGYDDGCSYDPAISDNGRYVAFYSCNDYFTGDETDGHNNVFLRDRWNQNTWRISVGLDGQPGNGNSWGRIGISADGSKVFFASWASNLVTGDNNDTLDVFVHDWQTQTTELLSMSASSEEGNADTGGGDPSADGNLFAFGSNASNLVPEDTNNTADAFLRNRASGTTERLSLTANGSQVFGSTGAEAISPDGRFVILYSSSSDLVTNDTNGVYDIFVHDTATGRTNRVSVSSNGTEANDKSLYLSDISLDGRAVAFTSLATNLVPGAGDNNNAWDIYIHEYAPCYRLDMYAEGSGGAPAPSIDHSIVCEPQTYHSGETITLTAAPAADWRIAGWLGTDNDASTSITNTVTMPERDHSVAVIYEVIPPLCYLLTLNHIGNGANPVADPPNSTGCQTGRYILGQSISLTADPDSGWRVKNWSGSGNDASKETTNSLVMPAGNHTVSVAYETISIVCHTLGRIHTGSGSDPVASPNNSPGCSAGGYTAGQAISLTADPDSGWRVKNWSGTANNASTSTINSLTMPAANHTVAVTYEAIPGTTFRTFMPSALNLTNCFGGPQEQEPNNSDNTANGPLCNIGVYTGLPNDERDFFMFETNVAGRIAVVATNLFVGGMQLSLYYESTEEAVVFDTQQGDGLAVELSNAPTGRYYVRVFTSQPDPSETRPYLVQITFP